MFSPSIHHIQQDLSIWNIFCKGIDDDIIATQKSTSAFETRAESMFQVSAMIFYFPPNTVFRMLTFQLTENKHRFPKGKTPVLVRKFSYQRITTFAIVPQQPTSD